MAKFTEDGHQIPDNTPVEIPVGFHHPEPLEVTIARLVRLESHRAAETADTETFEESDDFEIGDDGPVSKYEIQDMQPERPDLSKNLDPPGAKVQPSGVDKKTWAEFEAFRAFKDAQKAAAFSEQPEKTNVDSAPQQ